MDSAPILLKAYYLFRIIPCWATMNMCCIEWDYYERYAKTLRKRDFLFQTSFPVNWTADWKPFAEQVVDNIILTNRIQNAVALERKIREKSICHQKQQKHRTLLIFHNHCIRQTVHYRNDFFMILRNLIHYLQWIYKLVHIQSYHLHFKNYKTFQYLPEQFVVVALGNLID
jgi:hypothetical protein